MNDKRYHYVIVIGRIPFDDEDSLYTYTDLTLEEARRQFADDMYEDEAPHRRADVIAEIGGDLGVFITNMIVSDSPMTVFNW